MKILLVLILSGLHGVLTGKLRKAIREIPTEAKPSGRFLLPVGFVLVTLIVLLVTTKP